MFDVLFRPEILVPAAFVGWGIYKWNSFRMLDARCDAAQEDIDALLKRRADLLPNLTETVKKQVGADRELIATITDVQDRAVEAATKPGLFGSKKAEPSLSNLFGRLDQVKELRYSAHYADLRQQLKETEERLTDARQFLNLTVKEYNAAIGGFPTGFFAKFAGKRPRQGFNLGADRALLDEAPALNL